MSYSLLIFDWDGTLIDSAGRIVACMQAAAEDVGWSPLEDEAVRNIIGLGLPEAIRILCPGIEDERLELMRQRYSYYFIEGSQLPMPLFDGVAQGLERLHQAGYKLAVATGKSRRGLERAFQETGLGTLFHGARCADETRSKPDPRMLHELLDEFSMAPQQALMVGDTAYDMEMAQRAEMDRVAVSYGVHAHERLSDYAPRLLVHRFQELVDWLVA